MNCNISKSQSQVKVSWFTINSELSPEINSLMVWRFIRKSKFGEKMSKKNIALTLQLPMSGMEFNEKEHVMENFWKVCKFIHDYSMKENFLSRTFAKFLLCNTTWSIRLSKNSKREQNNANRETYRKLSMCFRVSFIIAKAMAISH